VLAEVLNRLNFKEYLLSFGAIVEKQSFTGVAFERCSVLGTELKLCAN